MAQQVKALAAKADDTNSIPGTYLVEGEFHKLSSDCHTYPQTYTLVNVII